MDFFKKCFLVCSICFLLIHTVSGQSVSITVNSNTYQTIDGIGGSIVYYTDWLTDHPHKEVLYDTLFTGLGLTSLRIGNWAQDLSADVSNDVEIVSKAHEQLGDNFSVIMSSWTAPASLKANNALHGSRDGITASLKRENGDFVYNQFGTWWRQSLEKYHALGIFPDYISIQNEPDYDADYDATVFNPTESSDIASYGLALEAVASAIDGMSHQPKLIGPEPLGIGWNTTQNYVNALDRNLLDAYAFHYYHSGITGSPDRYRAPDDFLPAMTAMQNDLNDKPLFMTENCSMRDHEPDDAIYLAWIMANAFNVNRVSAYLFWDLIWNEDGGAVGLENPWQSFSTSHGFYVNPEYHGLRHFSKFIKQGWLCLGVSSSDNDVLAVAFRSPQSDAYTIVLINKGTGSRTVSVSLPSNAPTQGELIQTVPSNNIWSNSLGEYSLGSTIDVPAMSITTIALEGIDMYAPEVVLTQPASQSLVEMNTELEISATATDSDGVITQVSFYANSELIEVVTTAPYSIVWTPSESGEYSITAVATDNDGNSTTSAPVVIRVHVPQDPYGGTAHPIPGTIQFEHFDVGGNGVAYYDDSPGTSVPNPPDYRTDEDVDIEECSDDDGGYNIGYATAGEWLEYTVNVQTAGVYTLTLRVACDGDGRTVSVSSNGAPIAENVEIPNTGGWQTWQDVVIEDVVLQAGEQVIRITIGAQNYVNLNYMTLELEQTGVEMIELQAGWNLIGSPLEGFVDLEDALSSIWEYVEEVKDMDGFYMFTNEPPMNSMKQVEFGKGYFIKVSEPCVLLW